MAKSDEARDGVVNKVVDDFVKSCSDEHRMLIILKAQLYGGEWEPMLEDLQKRLEEKPRLTKLARRIQDDIERIEEMQEIEAAHNIDLSGYVQLNNNPYLQASAKKIRAKDKRLKLRESAQTQRLVLLVYVGESVEDNNVVDGIIELYSVLSKYHVLCGGRGLGIDDWQMFVRETELAEVRQ